MWRFLKNLRRRPPRKVGLALSGGGARGLAHIGVLKVLEQENVPIDLLAGTSMGGVIAAIYATGASACEMEEAAQHLSSPRQLLTLVDRTLPRRGLLQGHKVMDYLAQWLGELTFDQLETPLALVAADLNGCQKVVLQEGPVLDAVRATIALPGLLAPLERDHQLLVDGGLIDNLPVDVVRQMGANVVIAVDIALPGLLAPLEQDGQLLVDGGLIDNLPVDVVRQMGANKVIAVDIATDQEAVILFAEELHRRRFMPNGLVDLVEVLWRSVEFLTTEVNRRVQEESPPDLVIHPTVPAGITALTGFTRAAETIAAGEKATIEALPQIQALLGSPSS